MLAGTLAIGLLYFTIRRSPRYWCFFLWAIALPLIVSVVFLQPILIDPWFNTFEPLDRPHPELVISTW